MNDGNPAIPGSGANGEHRTVDLLRKIEIGETDPKCIASADRRQLVAYLMGDGYSTAEIAQIFKVGDRTIERDKKCVREAHAIVRDPKLVEQMVGRLVSEAELSVQRIRRAVRDKKVAPAVKVDAEHRCFEIVSGLIQSMQRLGYLPTAAQKVEADLTHHAGVVPDFATIRAELGRLMEIGQSGADRDPGMAQQLKLLERKAAEADLATRVDEIKGQLAAEEGGSDVGG
jgi:hypothetical protein